MACVLNKPLIKLELYNKSFCKCKYTIHIDKSTCTSHESRGSTTAVDSVKLIWLDLIWPQGKAAFHCKKGLANVRDKKHVYVQALCIVVLEVLARALFLHFAGADKKVEGQKEGASDTWEKLCLHYLHHVHCFCRTLKRISRRHRVQIVQMFKLTVFARR